MNFESAYYIRTYTHTYIIEGSLEAKLPTIWRDGNGTARKKLGRGESQKGEDERWKRSEMEKVRREKMQVRKKLGKSRNTVFLQCFVAPEGRKGGSKGRLAKAAGAETSVQMRNENLHAVVARSTF